MRLKQKPVDASGRNWLLPFNDMMTLLLTFFVLILSLSKVDPGKVQSASQAVSNYLGVSLGMENTAVRVFDPFVFEAAEEGAQQPGVTPWGTKEDQERFLKIMKGMAGVKAKISDRTMEVVFDESIFFQTGGTTPAYTQHAGLLEILDVLKRTTAMVRIEDHTADKPQDADRYPSNWELSTARAVRFAEILTNGGIAASQNFRLRLRGPAIRGHGEQQDNRDEQITSILLLPLTGIERVSWLRKNRKRNRTVRRDSRRKAG